MTDFTQLKSDTLMEQMKLHLSSDAGKELIKNIGLVYELHIAAKVLSYLQWLIEEKESDDAQFHTTYTIFLAKSALDDYEMEHVLKSYVLNPIFESHVRERLRIFLHSSDLYDPEEVLDLIEGSELWMEKAILYRKLGQETLVLQILALGAIRIKGSINAAQKFTPDILTTGHCSGFYKLG